MNAVRDETLSVRDGRGNATQYTYNKDGQQTTVTDALGQVVARGLDRSRRQVLLDDLLVEPRRHSLRNLPQTHLIESPRNK